MLRTASLSDAPRLHPLLCQLEDTPFPYPAFTKCLRECLFDPRFACLVEEQEGEIAGFITLRIECQLHHLGLVGEIMELVVKDGFRGRHIGQKLLEAAKSLAREKGCLQLEVCCNRIRESSHRFYRRQGFIESHYKFTLPL